MTPMGYMAKKLEMAGALENFNAPPHVEDVCSVSNCISKDFCDYIPFWKHNGFWVFDSPDILRECAEEGKASLEGMTLFYYEIFEQQYNAEKGEWELFTPEPSFPLDVKIPNEAGKKLFGFDIATYSYGNSPECSPLSCNGLANEIPVNKHCLIDDFDEARRLLETGAF